MRCLQELKKWLDSFLLCGEACLGLLGTRQRENTEAKLRLDREGRSDLQRVLLHQRQEERKQVRWRVFDIPQHEPQALLGSHCQRALLEDKVTRLAADVRPHQVLRVEGLFKRHHNEIAATIAKIFPSLRLNSRLSLM